jgi:PPOX class probable FMN-dependent enzyme
MQTITSVTALESLYGEPAAAATRKVTPHITAHYGAFIAASPFVALATEGLDGLDCSPRGDKPGFVRIHDERTLMMPDRRGNNRVDSLRNIVTDSRVGLLFLIPGSGTTLRVNGTAVLAIEPALLDSFMMEGKPPRSVIVITVEAVYFQCARAIMRAGLWDPAQQVDPASLPTPGTILAALTAGEVGGLPYDQSWPERAAQSMW